MPGEHEPLYRELYDIYWSQWLRGKRSFMRETFADKLVKIFTPKHLLDVGCGPGDQLRRYLHLKQDAHAIELSHWMVKNRLRDLEQRKRVIEGSIVRIPHDNNQFDLVTCIEVLEHLPPQDVVRAVQELVRVSSRYIVCTISLTPSLLDLRELDKPAHLKGLKIHSTLREPEWWIRLFARYGATLCEDLTTETSAGEALEGTRLYVFKTQTKEIRKAVYFNLFSSNSLSVAKPVLAQLLQRNHQVRVVNVDPYVTAADRRWLLQVGIPREQGSQPFIQHFNMEPFDHAGLKDSQRQPMSEVVRDADIIFTPREGGHEQDGLMKDIIKLAPSSASFVLQHGVIPEDAIPNRVYFPFLSDALLLWSPYYYHWLAKRGMPREYLDKCAITGCPKFDALLNLEKNPEYIVIATNNHWPRYTEADKAESLMCITDIAKAFPQERIIWKTHPAERHWGYTDRYRELINTQRLSNLELQIDNISIPGLLAGAKLVVHTCSTVALEAMIADIPVMTLNFTDVDTQMDKFDATYYTSERLNVVALAERALAYPEEKTIGRRQLAQLHNIHCDGLATERVLELMENPGTREFFAPDTSRYRLMYDEYWSNWYNGAHCFMSNDFVDQIIDEFHPNTLLDVGCGPSENLRRFLERGIDAQGIEYSSWMVENQLSDLVEQGRVREGSATDLPFDDASFDLVYSIEVLEHLPEHDVESAIKELIRVSKGCIVCTIATTPSGGLDGPNPDKVRHSFTDLNVHATVQPIDWWFSLFHQHGMILNQELTDYFRQSNERLRVKTNFCVFQVSADNGL